jgi:flagellar motor switch protein FliN/FliY
MNKIFKHSDDKEKKVVTPVTFSNFQKEKTDSSGRNISMYMDIPKNLYVELGKTKKTIRELLEMEINEVVELNKQAGESVDIYLDDELIAKGEVVVIDDKFGVRIAEIVKATDLEKKIL